MHTGGMKSKSPSSRRNSELILVRSTKRKLQSGLNEAGKFIGVGAPRMVMFKKIAATISAVAFVMLAVALAPGVPAVLATVRTTVANDDAKLNQPLADQSCAAFEVWFLDPTCRQTHVKKVARSKGHLVHNAGR